MSRFALCLLIGSCLPTVALGQVVRSPLYVWTSPRCAPCGLFWEHYEADAGFRSAINAAFQVVPVEWEKEADSPTKRKIAEEGSIPAFMSARGTVYGYTGPDALLARLGLTRIGPRAPAPQTQAPVRENPGVARDDYERALSGFNDRIGGLAGDVERVKRELEGQLVKAQEAFRRVEAENAKLLARIEALEGRPAPDLSGLAKSEDVEKAEKSVIGRAVDGAKAAAAALVKSRLEAHRVEELPWYVRKGVILGTGIVCPAAVGLVTLLLTVRPVTRLRREVKALKAARQKARPPDPH